MRRAGAAGNVQRLRHRPFSEAEKQLKPLTMNAFVPFDAQSGFRIL
jgi:hypothetical protein